MDKLQDDFTTPEQSKRLLKIGVPPQSANFYWGIDGKPHYIDGSVPPSLLFQVGALPCWSGMRLMEIYDICYDGNGDWPKTTDMTKTCGSVIEYLVTTFEIHPPSRIDFSKLKLKN